VRACAQDAGDAGGAIAATNAEVALEHCWFEGNSADTGGALRCGYVFLMLRSAHARACCALLRAGAVATSNTDLQIHYSTFLENDALTAEGDGGALRVGVQANDQPCVIAFSHFTRNQAGRDGGAIFAIGDRTNDGRRLALQLHHDEFEGNTAVRFGGSVATTGGVSVSARECAFHASSDSVRLTAIQSSSALP
jgi:predicted outer membrane repeat protein